MFLLFAGRQVLHPEPSVKQQPVLAEVLFVFAGGSGRKRLIRRMSPILVNDF
ncbi:hypothetical protein [Rhizobium sp. SGZ-381]|uniref:hypothetical protein n=1 Tax=Rhizobium sp. SGZ-381 TaxID=3342800 RepID=UPI0036702762